MSTSPYPLTKKKITLTVTGATCLPRRRIFGAPNPFAALFVEDEMVHTTAVVKNTNSPCWNEAIDIVIKESSVITVGIFDQHRLRRNRALGATNIGAGEVLDLGLNSHKTLTLDLKRKNDTLTRGKLLISFSGGISQHTSNPPPPGTSSFITAATDSRSRDPQAPDILHGASYTSGPLCMPPPCTAETNAPTFASAASAEREPQTSSQQYPTMIHPTPISRSTFPPTISSSQLALRTAAQGSEAFGAFSQDGDTPHVSKEGPLPYGWEMHQTSVFYVDHFTRTTTCGPGSGNVVPNTHPVDPTPDPSERLPRGWEKRPTTDGRTYYIDYNTKTTTWNRPNLGNFAMTDAELYAPLRLPPLRCLPSTLTGLVQEIIARTPGGSPPGWKCTAKQYPGHDMPEDRPYHDDFDKMFYSTSGLPTAGPRRHPVIAILLDSKVAEGPPYTSTNRSATS
ncbi:hypothetical protein P691DRAFT_785226 [Macrolepiota fuliginosa MF-IS2]|uniref:HECT-type E3 ubiquitin transferase n=1 Tax=Macrolepiota fuliginosa MF-IS2 TaxID=1400762 RepID=A0A9P6C1K5_9AGAR|nr:hypothetical protein P691DRAFT_785226 [Macrolepiota fuliginosa MF-IS2]